MPLLYLWQLGQNLKPYLMEVHGLQRHDGLWTLTTLNFPKGNLALISLQVVPLSLPSTWDKYDQHPFVIVNNSLVLLRKQSVLVALFCLLLPGGNVDVILCWPISLFCKWGYNCHCYE